MIENKTIDRFEILRRIFIFLMVLIIGKLFYITIIKGDYYYLESQTKIFRKIPISAPRGEIRDRYGRLLATSRPSFAVYISKNEVLTDNINASILDVIRIIEKNKDLVVDEFPIVIENGKFECTYDKKIEEWKEKNNIPLSYNAKKSFKLYVNNLASNGEISSQEVKGKDDLQLQKILNEKGYYPPIYVSKEKFAEQVRKEEWLYHYKIRDEKDLKTLSARQIFNKIRKFYEIDSNMSTTNARKIMNIRDSLNSAAYLQYKPVKIAQDISEITVAEIEEKSSEIPGVSVEVEPVRFYPNANSSAHILGQIGKISQATEIDKYVKEKGYNLFDMIGKTGVEKNFEDYLKGKEGYKRVLVDSKGRLIEKLDYKAPIPGNTLYLTIDLDLQKKAEESLKEVLHQLQIGGSYNSQWGNSPLRDKKVYSNAKSGAVVAVDVKTGDVLALASYPDYDPNLFSKGISSENMKKLLPENPNDLLSPRPLYNVATMSAVQPGSVFKMITGLSALENGLSPNYTIYDKGFIQQGQNRFGCWIWNSRRGSHGSVNIEKALQESCNFYFYSLSVGYDYGANKPLPVKMSIEDILKYSRMFGLDELTGVQIEEFSGKVPNPERKKASIKAQLRFYLKEALRGNFKNSKITDDEFNSSIDEIVSWMDENPSRGEVIKRLINLDIKEEKISEIADKVKFNYFIQGKWQNGDSFNIAIGQGENSFTPIQLARYVSALANGGYKNKLTVVDKIESYDKLKIKNIERISEKIALKNPENLKYLLSGMKKVSEQGTAQRTFKNFPVSIGGKTGTAEKSGKIPTADEEQYLLNHMGSFGVNKDEVLKLAESLSKKEKGRNSKAYYMRKAIMQLNHKIGAKEIDRFKSNYDNFGVFVSFAPYENPEIAVAVMIFQGGHGGYGGPIARDVIAEYFNLKEAKEEENKETLNFEGKFMP